MTFGLRVDAGLAAKLDEMLGVKREGSNGLASDHPNRMLERIVGQSDEGQNRLRRRPLRPIAQSGRFRHRRDHRQQQAGQGIGLMLVRDRRPLGHDRRYGREAEQRSQCYENDSPESHGSPSIGDVITRRLVRTGSQGLGLRVANPHLRANNLNELKRSAMASRVQSKFSYAARTLGGAPPNGSFCC